jgi:hypothetical protein
MTKANRPIVTLDSLDVFFDNDIGINILFSYLSNGMDFIKYEDFIKCCFDVVKRFDTGYDIEQFGIQLLNELDRSIKNDGIFLLIRVLFNGNSCPLRVNLVTEEFKEDFDLKLEVLNSNKLYGGVK